MKVLDVNVVLPAHRGDHPDHHVARRWMDNLWNARDQFTVPWIVWWSFLRLASNKRIFANPTPVAEARHFITAVRAQVGHLDIDTVSAEHLDHLVDVCTLGEASSNLIPDAVLAALAIEHAGEVVSFDRDFGRFPNLRWSSPADD